MQLQCYCFLVCRNITAKVTYFSKTYYHTRCSYGVPGMSLLQAYQYTYNLLRGGHLQSTPLSSYTLSPMMLPLLETFPELLLWNSVQSRCNFFFWMFSLSLNLHPFKEDFILGNSHKIYGAKSGEQGECSILVIDFWTRHCLTESIL